MGSGLQGMDTRKPVREKTVRIGPMAKLPAISRSLGHDPEPIFKSNGFDPKIFRDPDRRVSYIPMSHLLSECARITACDHLGLLMGQHAEPSHLGMPGFLVHTAPTVEQALQSLVETLDLHDEGGTAAFNVRPEFSSISYAIHLDGVEAIDITSDLAAVMICKIMRFLCGPDWAPLSVRFARKEPADRAQHRRFFKSALYFDATETEVNFNNRCLQEQPPAPDVLLHRHLEQEANTLHALQYGELMEQLPAVLRRSLLDGRFSAPEVAESVGLHERTLHRRLKEAGTSFRQELDASRRTVSEQMLQFTRMPVSEIATALGYADASGFIRAFERWSGISPNAWRKQNQAP